MAGVGPVERMHRAEEKFEARRNGEGDVVRVVGHGVGRHDGLVAEGADGAGALRDKQQIQEVWCAGAFRDM